MLDAKYYKDLNHNYLIIKCDESSGDKYQLKMITANHIEGLLPCSTRYINGNIYLYYEINSKQTLKSIYEYKKIDKKQTVMLLVNLRKVLKKMQDFLLVDNGLVLSPEYIFMNRETEDILFLYYPYGYEESEHNIQGFLEYLTEIIDHNDESLVDMIYGLCQLAERGQFIANELDYYIEGTCSCHMPVNEHYQTVQNNAGQPEEEEEEEKLIKPIEKRQEVKFILSAVTSVMGIAVVLYLRGRYLLTHQENLILWILLFTFLLVLIITMVIYILLKSSICSERKCPESFPGSEKVENQRFSTGEPCGNPVYPAMELEQDDREQYGDTVFLYSTLEVRENKLYGISKGNKYHIDLSRLPCTIGKMVGCTDYCIPEASISRMHVKFTQKDNAIFMTDLNSTNGTFRNGLRLEPSETVQIEPGDEIRLGKLTFCYR